MIWAVIQIRARSSFPSIISPHPYQPLNLFYQSLLQLCDIWVNFMIYLVLLAQSVWSMNRNCLLESRKVTSEHRSKDMDSPFGEMSVASNSFLKDGTLWAHPLNMFDYWQANFYAEPGKVSISTVSSWLQCCVLPRRWHFTAFAHYLQLLTLPFFLTYH